MRIAEQRNEDLARWAKTIEKLNTGMLVTQSDNGTLRGRPLTPIEIDATPTIWFLVGKTAELIDDVKDCRQVCLTFAHPTGDYSTVSGTATTSSDRQRLEALWNPAVELYFPAGIDDPELLALAVTVHEAEYWDTPDGKLRRTLAFARAISTGNQAAIGAHHKVAV